MTLIKKTDTKTFTEEHPLPPVLKKALARERKIEIPEGTFTLLPWREARVIALLVNHLDKPDEGLIHGNPYWEDAGRYIATAYALTTKITAPGEEEDMLLWLPVLNMFGWWNSGGHRLHLYPATTWAMIEQELPQYLAMHKEDVNILCHLKVWEYFDFVPHDLVEDAEAIVCDSARNNDDKIKEAEAFTWWYGRTLLRHPFDKHLYNQHAALLSVYVYLLQNASRRRTADVLAWHEKAHMLLQRLYEHALRREKAVNRYAT